MIDQTLAPHIDPDTYTALADLQAQIAAGQAKLVELAAAVIAGNTAGAAALLAVAQQLTADMKAADSAIIGRLVILEAGAPVPPPVPVNQPPVWTTVPAIVFTQGKAATFSIASYVTDSDPLTITKNAAALPQGVTYNPVLMAFVYDGVGPAAPASQHFLIADDGRP
jgi:hypothetical protein